MKKTKNLFLGFVSPQLIPPLLALATFLALGSFWNVQRLKSFERADEVPPGEPISFLDPGKKEPGQVSLKKPRVDPFRTDSPQSSAIPAIPAAGPLPPATKSFPRPTSAGGRISAPEPVVADTVPPVVAISNISILSQSKARISWVTSEPAIGWVEYGPSPALNTSSARQESRELAHGVELNDLSPGTLYRFRVVATDSSGNSRASIDYNFATRLGSNNQPVVPNLPPIPKYRCQASTYTCLRDDASGTTIDANCGGICVAPPTTPIPPPPPPSVPPNPVPSPGPNLTDGCPSLGIWNGQRCRSISTVGQTVVVGLDQSIDSRSELDEIEKSFVKRSFDGFPTDLFNPNTREKGQRIQDIRLNATRRIGGDYERTWEFLINSDMKTKLDQNATRLGTDGAISWFIKHQEAENEVWANSLPSIHRQAVIKRIIVVSSKVLSQSGGAREVTNDFGFGYWPNDKLNGAQGFTPFDIDSRWTFDDSYGDYALANLSNWRKFQSVPIDYSALHELTHHFPVGDNYSYNIGQGRGIVIPQPNGRNAVFHYSELIFMPNDHMTDQSAIKLTAPSSYYINFFWLVNPKMVRSPQAVNLFPESNVYDSDTYYHDPVTLEVVGLQNAGIESCNLYRLGSYPEGQAPIPLVVSSNYLSINFSNGVCTVVLNRRQQMDHFPGIFIGVVKQGNMFPIYIGRNILGTLAWSTFRSTPGPGRYSIQVTPQFSSALANYSDQINSAAGNDVNLNAKYTAYADIMSPGSLPANAIFYLTVDSLNNQYIIEYKPR